MYIVYLFDNGRLRKMNKHKCDTELQAHSVIAKILNKPGIQSEYRPYKNAQFLIVKQDEPFEQRIIKLI